jgi:predicted dehydrogenase/threonine dehydrogenase-like Zn-dependent dehydrogenase
MKQVVQNFKTGELKIEELPPPALRAGGVLVRTAYSLISAGTERSTVATGQSSLVGKARKRPDLVKQVFDTLRREGLRNTYEKVMARLETVKALGYSSAGTVTAVGEGVAGIHVGDRVACAGAGYASHAEVNFIPANLCAPVPERVSLDLAAYTTLGAIALQGVRQSRAQLGESVVVIGLGLVGQITIQLLAAAGCRIFGIDIDKDAIELALKSGAHEAALRSEGVHKLVESFTRGRGADQIIITASTSSNDPVKLAGEIARDRARIVVVGDVKMDFPREYYFQKELELCLSRSYGPGRYDVNYEERGIDYPIGYVRWTEKRNMEEFLRLTAEGRLNLELLTTHRYKVEDATAAYNLILGKTGERFCGVLLEYGTEHEIESKIVTKHGAKSTLFGGRQNGNIGVGFIGAGNFATASLLPHLRAMDKVALTGLANSTGVSGKNTAERFRFNFCSADPKDVIENPETQCVFIATRHNLHAPLVRDALSAGRAVFVEKPLCLNELELKEISAAYNSEGAPILVGFNRRFSPLAEQIKQAMGRKTTPYSIIYRVNAGFIPKDHWTQDSLQGGGRIIGEACHFIDLMQYFTGAEPVRVFAECIATSSDKEIDEDTVAITLKFSDGSIGTIHYLAVGDKSFPKERVEIFGSNIVAVLDDFKLGTLTKDGVMSKFGKGVQDKGHSEEIRRFIEAVKQGSGSPIPFRSLVATTLATFRAIESLKTGTPVVIDVESVLNHSI